MHIMPLWAGGQWPAAATGVGDISLSGALVGCWAAGPLPLSPDQAGNTVKAKLLQI